MADPLLLSRRQFATAAAAIVPAASGLAQGAPRGQPDLLRTWARLHGALDGSVGYAWFDGAMVAVAPGGAIERLCGYRGVIARRLRPLADGRGWRVERRELGAAHAADGAEAFINPITGAIVVPGPPDLRVDGVTLDATAAAGLGWSAHGHSLSIDQPFRVVRDEQASGDPHERTMRESVSATFALDHAARDDRAAIRSSGTMLRTGAWPAWLGMDKSPGHVLYQARLVAGLGSFAEVPAEVRRVVGTFAYTLLRRFA